MSDIWIKTQNGSPLARIRIGPGGLQYLYKQNGQHLGTYNPQTNTTHYSNGGVYCIGNALAALIDI